MDFQGAIDDYTKAIAIDPSVADFYINRGLTEIQLKEKKNACADFEKAVRLGDAKVNQLISKYCY